MKKAPVFRLRHACSLLLLVAAAPPLLAQNPPDGSRPPPATAAGADPAPTPTADQADYLLGLMFGAQMHGAGIGTDASLEAMMRGVHEGLQGKPLTVSDQQQIQSYLRSVLDQAVARNQAAAKEFLARNAHEKGVVTTASGLEYKVLEPGDRKAAAILPADRVTVEYRGTLLDGTEFDSSYSRGMPATFPISGVIRGWQEALVLMKPGAKWRLFVPPDLAYGAQGQQPTIPGGSLLIFDVNVVHVESSKPTAVPVPRTNP
jgi:FKBP-type peptidyl-prolyl cis-trans isomerase FklB